MKKHYIDAICEVLDLTDSDIIATSGGTPVNMGGSSGGNEVGTGISYLSSGRFKFFAVSTSNDPGELYDPF